MGTQMDRYDDTLKKGLSDHLEENVTAVDLWASVQERLAADYRAQGDVACTEVDEDTFVGVAQRIGLFERVRGWFVPYAWGAVGLVVLVLVMTAAVAGLGKAGGNNGVPSKGTPAPQATKIVAVPQSPDYDYVFTVQRSVDLLKSKEPPYGFGTGFDVADDGSYWIGLGSSGIAHYSAAGEMLGKFDTTDTLGQVSDLEWGDGSIWAVQGVHIYKLSNTMAIQEQFEPIMSVPGTSLDPRPELLAGSILRNADGQMLLEQEDSTSFLKVTNQTRGKDGSLQPPPLAGYPSNGVYYSVMTIGSYFGTTQILRAGDMQVSVPIPSANVDVRLHILQVSTDGSFYVVSEQVDVSTPARVYVLKGVGNNITVFHFDAMGKLLERARVGVRGSFYTTPRQIAIGPDGNLYAEGVIDIPYLRGIQSGRQIVARMKFYPADEPLPTLPVPTSLPAAPTSKVPVEVPTLVMPPMTPAIAAPTAMARPDKNEVLYPVFIGNAPDGQLLQPYESLTIGEDGSIWIADRRPALINLRANGEVSSTITLDPKIGRVSDLEIVGGNFWVLDGFAVYKVAMDGRILEEYQPYENSSSPMKRPYVNLSLRVGGDGQMLVELGGDYTSATENVPEGQYGPSFVLHGYPSKGRVYAYGSKVDEILAGEVVAKIDVPGSITGRHVLKVLPDGSFYVLVETSVARMSDATEGSYFYVMHYGSDGKLIERARMYVTSDKTPKVNQMALGSDGQFYSLLVNAQDRGRVDIVRLRYYAAGVQLPNGPTPAPPAVPYTPTINEPTVVPTSTVEVNRELGISDLSFIDANNGWAVVRWCVPDASAYGGCVPKKQIYGSPDGGATWEGISRVYSSGDAVMKDVWRVLFVDKENGWAWDNEAGHNGVFATTDGGKTWESEDAGGLLTSIVRVGDEVWALREGGCTSGVRCIVHTKGRGDGWAELANHPDLVNMFMGLVVGSEKEVWVVSGSLNPNGFTYDKSLSVTHDGGLGWSSANLTSACNEYEISQLEAQPGGHLWWFCYDGQGFAGRQGKRIYRSDDGAASWRIVADASLDESSSNTNGLPSFGYGEKLVATGENTAWITLGRSWVYGTTDGGATWNYAQTPDAAPYHGGEDLHQEGLTFVDAENGWFAVRDTIFRTRDGGKSWDWVRVR